MTKKLYRSTTNKVIGGVCGGLGEYFNIDPVIVRLIVVAFTLMGGSGVLAYIIGYVVIPANPASQIRSADQSMGGADKSGSNPLVKVILIILIVMVGMALLSMAFAFFRFTMGTITHGFRF